MPFLSTWTSSGSLSCPVSFPFDRTLNPDESRFEPEGDPKRKERNQGDVDLSDRTTKARGEMQGGARACRMRSRKVAMAAATPAKRRLKTHKWKDVDEQRTLELLARPRVDFGAILGTVAPIVEDVRVRGDQALVELTEKFDNAKVEVEDIVVDPRTMTTPHLPDDVRAAFDVAFDNIAAFHEAQRTPEPTAVVETMPGVRCSRVSRPIEAVGLYVPGGTAVLPSTALMLSVPAAIAGCKVVVMATPPRPDGSITPEVLYCAQKAGVTHLLKAGGAQAVAAMAHGTATCPKVDKIFGPGNQYVTAAKMLLQNSEAMVAIDMPAGPSEVLVVADEGADPVHVAADLLSQAEHGPDSQVVLVALPGVDVDAIEREVEKLLGELPRGEVAAKAIEHSYAVQVDSIDEAINFSNRYAPEHLIVNVEDAESWLPQLTNAGSIFLGRWTPESVGDYASGTNHVLPTYGYARMYSGVNLDSFQKKITVQSLTRDGLRALGPHVAKMAEVEGLDAHRKAVTLRMESMT